MKLRIGTESPATNYLDTPDRCWICGGEFLLRGWRYGIYVEDENTDSVRIGLSCEGCAVLSANDITSLLQWQSYSLDYKSYTYDSDARRLSHIKGFIDNGDVAAATAEIEKWTDEALTMSRHWNAESRRLTDYAENYEIEPFRLPKAAENAPKNDGYVYLLGSPEGYCKIGRAKNLSSRLLSIGLQLPFRVEILHSIRVSDRVWAERFLHQKFAVCRMNGEWFLLSDSDINWIKSLTSLEPEG